MDKRTVPRASIVLLNSIVSFGSLKKVSHMSIFSKDLIGKTVVLMPKGNAVKRGDGAGSPAEQTFEAVVTDVKRVNITFARLDGIRVGQFKMNEGHRHLVEDASNSGYYVYSNWVEFHTYRKSEAVKSRLAESVKGYGASISPEQYIQIAELLGWSDITGSSNQAK
jgi:hypothetical protein